MPQDYLAGSEWILNMGFGQATHPWMDTFDSQWSWDSGHQAISIARNERVIPTITVRAKETKAVRPDHLSLQPY